MNPLNQITHNTIKNKWKQPREKSFWYVAKYGTYISVHYSWCNIAYHAVFLINKKYRVYDCDTLKIHITIHQVKLLSYKDCIFSYEVFEVAISLRLLIYNIVWTVLHLWLIKDIITIFLSTKHINKQYCFCELMRKLIYLLLSRIWRKL